MPGEDDRRRQAFDYWGGLCKEWMARGGRRHGCARLQCLWRSALRRRHPPSHRVNFFVGRLCLSLGRQWRGQLGDGTTTDHTATDGVIAVDFGADAVAAGDAHTLALRPTDLVGLGANDHGQLRDGTTDDRALPIRVVGLSDVVEVEAAGPAHRGPSERWTVWAWGENTHGQLGDGTTFDRSVPVQVAITDVTEADGRGRPSASRCSGTVSWRRATPSRLPASRWQRVGVGADAQINWVTAVAQTDRRRPRSRYRCWLRAAFTSRSSCWPRPHPRPHRTGNRGRLGCEWRWAAWERCGFRPG